MTFEQRPVSIIIVASSSWALSKRKSRGAGNSQNRDAVDAALDSFHQGLLPSAVPCLPHSGCATGYTVVRWQRNFLEKFKTKQNKQHVLLSFDWWDVTQKGVVPAFTCVDNFSPDFNQFNELALLRISHLVLRLLSLPVWPVWVECLKLLHLCCPCCGHITRCIYSTHSSFVWSCICSDFALCTSLKLGQYVAHEAGTCC